MKKVLRKKTNFRKMRSVGAAIMTIAIISGYLAPMEGVLAADNNHWGTEYYVGDEGIPINDEEGIQYLDVENGQTVNFHMLLTEKSTAGLGRFRETFSITMPEMLYDQVAEESDILNGWLESNYTDCGYLLEVVDDTGTATNSNATISNSLADKNQQSEEGMQKLTFRFVEELRNGNNPKNINVINAEGMLSFTAPVDGKITITKDGNGCRIEMQMLSRMDARATGYLVIGGSSYVSLLTDNNGTGWTWDSYSNTLNFNRDYTGENINIGCANTDKIKLIYEGNVTIDSIYCTGSLEISGSGGTLVVNGDGINSIGDITITAGIVTSNGDYSGIYSYGDITISGGIVTSNGFERGIYSGGDIIITGGIVTSSSNARGINSGGDITITGGIVAASGFENCGINSEGDVTITGGTVEATGEGSGINSRDGITISGGTITANGRNYDIYSSLVITGGSVYLENNSLTQQPKDANNNPVYLNILTVGDTTNANSDVTDVSVTNLGYDYGINDVHTDESGMVYFWLPKTGNDGNDKETVSVTVNGDDFAHSWGRKENKETETLVLQAKPNIETVSLPEGKVGESYSHSLKATGTEPINWSKLSGNLPSGLILNQDGEISGIPEATGTVEFAVMAENNLGSDSAKFSITIIDKPSTPVNLTATPSNRQVELNWETPNNGGSVITKYQYSASAVGEEDIWKDISGSDATTISYIVTSLINGNQYTMKVRAVNAVGNGEEAVITVTPHKSASAPTAPGNLTTMSGNRHIELKWTTPDNGGSTIMKYQYSTDEDFWRDIPGSDATTNSYTVTGLISGTQYTLQIRAVNAVGNGLVASVTVRTISENSDSGSSNTESTNQWISDEKGWWYRYDNGTWPANCWVYLYYNGFYAWYHFDVNGYMQTSWFTDTDGYRYYLNPVSDGTKGAMKTGWVLIDEKWYYFNYSAIGTKGALLTSTTTPDGYQVDENGVWN